MAGVEGEAVRAAERGKPQPEEQEPGGWRVPGGWSRVPAGAAGVAAGIGDSLSIVSTSDCAFVKDVASAG